jgi:peptidoglycan/xylan/chitin deacetylase (PgdA/CDA1 family)
MARVARKVVITVDDLPLADFDRYSNAELRTECVTRFVSLLKTRRIPTTGFFNMSVDARDKALLPMWKSAGMQLGNHTWSHPALAKIGLDAYLTDLERGHRAIAALAPSGAAIPFRYPFLNEGFAQEERDRIRAKLTDLKSVVAPVTIDTSDWLYARGYLDAVKAGDSALRDRYRQSWMWNLRESTLVAEFLARELFGREPPQILLIHGNLLNADHLGEYFDWLTARGYAFITLSEALADPAYQESDASTSPTGDSHWLRLMRSRDLRVPPTR